MAKKETVIKCLSRWIVRKLWNTMIQLVLPILWPYSQESPKSLECPSGPSLHPCTESNMYSQNPQFWRLRILWIGSICIVFSVHKSSFDIIWPMQICKTSVSLGRASKLAPVTMHWFLYVLSRYMWLEYNYQCMNVETECRLGQDTGCNVNGANH